MPRIKMQQPDRTRLPTKTLMDIYEEKANLLQQGQPFSPGERNAGHAPKVMSLEELRRTDENDELSPLTLSVLFTLTLTLLYGTLDFLVQTQYRQTINYSLLAQRVLVAPPVLFTAIYFMHTPLATRYPILRNGFFWSIAVVCGCYVIHVTNRYDYYFVMKQAPPVGTLWVWSVLEMEVWFAVTSAAVNLGFLWWRAYSIT